jgi:hypothetical protein
VTKIAGESRTVLGNRWFTPVQTQDSGLVLRIKGASSFPGELLRQIPFQ